MNPWGCSAHRGPHAGVAVANPPGSGAAHHSFLEPQAFLHRAVPHGIPPDPLRQPMGARPRAGLLEARAAPNLGDLVWLDRFLGYKRILVSRKSILPLKNYYKSIFSPKNAKPFT
jgi:hypothetical protein